MKASVKYKVIYRHREKYSISEMCRFFGVSRSGYYGYLKRMEIPAKDMPLAEKIRECQAECKSTYGYRRVHIWLERHGIYHNPKTVLRVMNKYNLLSVIRRKRYVKYGEAIHRYPNLLNRNFVAERPNQKWVTDISYIRTGQGFLYLSVIRDLYDNSIIAYKTGTEQTRIKPLQYSVMGSVGAQYGLSRHFALYVEPGISYFFDDGSSVQTIRKENPLNFNLQTGIRLTY